MRKCGFQRPLWEHVLLRLIAQSAQSLGNREKTVDNDVTALLSKESINALSDALRELRQKDRKRALAEIYRISRELRLYDEDDMEDDADDHAGTVERDQATV